ncbi:MAG: aminotransferase class V-fold PLP-dependent enzyme [Crocinitomicaceae bacterium]|nr:aminotransferase class V-fold PLP-dependent enzyme [Crocinitomicaceae bacterium]
MVDEFLFDKEMVYLNHGSFGATPKDVFEDYRRWQLELEFSPVQFITKKFKEANNRSKEALAKFINTNPKDIVYSPNPTTAFNTVIRSLELNEGDEILSTNLEYGALDRTWRYYCEKSGAKYLRQNISLPIKDKESFLEEFWKGLSDKTKYIFISQITSSTALILPVKEICEKARELGLITIIDGAHVPGHIPLDLKDLDPDYYTGACHKWMLTPKGCTFLYVKPELQDGVDPLIISWGYEADVPGESQYLDYLEYSGTNDSSAFLTLPASLNFFKKHDWLEKTNESKQIIREACKEFCDLLNTEPLCPVTEEFLGQICSIPINTTDPIGLKEELYQKYNIEIPITNLEDRFFIRISFQPFNTRNDLDALKNALIEIREKRPDLLS